MRLSFLPSLLVAAAAAGCYSSGDRHSMGTTDASCADPFTDATGTPAPDAPDVPWNLDPPEGGCPHGWTCRTSELPTFRGVDILVVVDDSKSMADEQATMAQQFPLLISSLLDPTLSTETARPIHVPITDLHIGVVSTDMGTGGYRVETCSDSLVGDDGMLQHLPNPRDLSCLESYPDYLQYDTETVDPEGVDAISSAFGCIGTLGTDGCGFEQPLKAAWRAVEYSIPSGPHAGFLRDDSVLMLIFLTDEEDCSVVNPIIFDTSDFSLGHLNLRCFRHPEMIHGVEQYIDFFRGLREDSIWPLLLGMIVGVPPGVEACNGFGDAIGDCLYVPQMQEQIDPGDPSRLLYSCNTDFGYAFPPRRLVQMAQAFGHDAYVHSLCQGDYEPILSGLANLANNFADGSCDGIIVDLFKGTPDPCLCNTTCRVVHVLSDAGACPAGTRVWDHDDDTIPDEVTDADGHRVTACEVPYAGTGLGNCDRGCHHVYQTHHPVFEGWYYSLDYVGVACPTVKFTEEFEPPAGATSFVACPP